MAESNVKNLEKYVEYKFPGDKKDKYQSMLDQLRS